MRTVVIIAAVLCTLGVLMSKMADRMSAAPSANAATQGAAPATSKAASATSSGLRSINIPKDRRGHFQTSGRVQGHGVGFIVDTGATVIALRESDAAKAGVRVEAKDYTRSVVTANGSIKAAAARLTNVEIGDLKLYDVDAVILPDSALSENLLGLSFLNRLRRFEMSANRVVLEQ